MAAEDLANRVAILEQKVEGLETLPARLESVEGRLKAVESQIVQLRAETRDGFSAVRVEIQSESRRLVEMMDERFIRQDVEMHRLIDETKAEMRSLNDETKAEMHRLNDETKAEMRRLNGETSAQMRLLYEDLKDTIKRITLH